MKLFPPPPRSSAIGPLCKMSHIEQSVICLHCQKVHNPGFIWKFSETVRVCFTCFREMGEDARKTYERHAAKTESKKAASLAAAAKGKGYTRKMMGILALLIVLGAGAFYFCHPLTGEIAELRALLP